MIKLTGKVKTLSNQMDIDTMAEMLEIHIKQCIDAFKKGKVGNA